MFGAGRHGPTPFVTLSVWGTTTLAAYTDTRQGCIADMEVEFTGRLHLRRTAEEKQPLLQRLDRIEG